MENKRKRRVAEKGRTAKLKGKAEVPKFTTIGQSMKNNLHSITDNKYNAEKAKFILARLKKLTGQSEQKLLVNLILAGFEVSQTCADFRESIRMEWNTEHDDPTTDLF